MKTKILSYIIFFTPLLCFAELDYNLKAQIRSFALSGGLIGEVGYGQKIWGGNKPYYGYIRPNFQLATSGGTNRAKWQVDLYPISFFGVYVGGSYSDRAQDELSGLDCRTIKCDGKLDREFLGTKLGLEFLNIFVLSEGRKTKIIQRNGQGENFGDESSRTTGRFGHDWDNHFKGTIGYKLSQDIKAGIIYGIHKMEFSDEETSQIFLFSQYSKDKWTYSFALGVYKTRARTQHATIAAGITWNGQKGLPLF